jgi:hypothetical protein
MISKLRELVVTCGGGNRGIDAGTSLGAAKTNLGQDEWIEFVQMADNIVANSLIRTKSKQEPKKVKGEPVSIGFMLVLGIVHKTDRKLRSLEMEMKLLSVNMNGYDHML